MNIDTSVIARYIHKDKFNQLIGYVNAGSVILLNGEPVEAIEPLNIYDSSSAFFDWREANDLDDSTMTKMKFIEWLCFKGIIKPTIYQFNVSNPPLSYLTFPFVPNYKDILWVTRILKDQIQMLSVRDVYMLAIFKDMEIEGFSIQENVIKRNVNTVRDTLILLEKTYRHDLELFLNSIDEDGSNVERSSKVSCM